MSGSSVENELMQTIKAAEDKFKIVFDLCPAAMAIRTLAELRYVDVNKAWLSTTKFTKEEVIGKTATELNIIDNFLLWSQKNDILKHNSATSEILFRTKLGEARVGLWTFSIIQLNQVLHVLTSLVDITEKKHTEQEMARLESFNVIGEMAASIGHEVRNPMTTVRGYIQLFQRKERFLEYAETFNVILDEIDRANSIITEFLSLAKNKSFNFKLCNLTPIVLGLLPLLKADALRLGCEVGLELKDTPAIFADEDSIRQLILNLVRNGFDAMHAGGFLTIKSYNTWENVILEVKDTGIGIAQELLDKIWKPFFTTKENGTGLGLPVCYRIAQRHGASIAIQSTSEGTSVVVKFKAAENSAC